MGIVKKPALIGKAGEMLVAAELMRRGVEVAFPASDVGVDMLASRLEPGQKTAGMFVPIQVKARSASGYNFQKAWFNQAPGLMLVHVWFTWTQPQFYIFRDLADVEDALDTHARSPSWIDLHGYSQTVATDRHLELMQPFRDRWEWIIERVGG